MSRSIREIVFLLSGFGNLVHYLSTHPCLLSGGGISLERKRLQFILEVAILGAISFVLDKIGFSMPQGGSITLSMLPIIVMAFRWGIAGGMLTGFVSGLLQLLMGGYVFNAIQAALDYFVAYTFVGLAAVTLGWLLHSKAAGKKGSMVTAIVVGTVIGGLLRYLIHFIGGIVFFGSYAPEGQPVWLYSLVYNGSYMIPAILVTAVITSLLFTSAPRLLQRN